MKCKVTLYTFLCMLLFGTLSCKDDLLYDNEQANHGECVISGSVKFKPFTPALSTRTAGNAIKAINSLCVLLYDESGNLVNKYPINDYEVTNTDRTEGDIAETQTPCATFKLKVPYGTYYIYAVTNMGDLSEYAEAIKTVETLKNISLVWNEKQVASNSQMFGHFSEGEEMNNEEAPQLTLNKPDQKLKAWVRRAASKVTVAFDGSGLNEGVSITLKALRIKRIPKTCKLGAKNTVGNEKEFIETGEEVPYKDSPLITNATPYYPRVQKEDGTWEPDPNRHSETNPHSLFFYENMQGSGDDKPDKQQHDKNNDGTLDEMYPYKEMPYATYIEVDTHYESTNPERPGICNITYRFMLGQNVTTDYDAKRNCHYKLTLHFNGFADEPDWRIDYVTRLGVTNPKVVDYRGKYFVPDNVSANQGDNFENKNAITVRSFQFLNDSWEVYQPVPYKIEYRDSGTTEFSSTPPAWFSLPSPLPDPDNSGESTLKITYQNPFTQININEVLGNTSDVSPNPYDLSTKGGTELMNTANCYIVNSKGTYRLPLVYGNAITDGKENKESFTFGFWGWGEAEHCLTTFKNYKNEGISSPYILKDIYGTNIPDKITASLIWQDEENLISKVDYVSGEQCIEFTIGEDIKEGNALIALKDPDGTIMWSWHIWVTAMDMSRTFILTNASQKKFEIMPVNLGWCSGGSPIRYYDRHMCEVKFTQIIDENAEGEERYGVSQTVKIVQESHIALPVGDNPYYQWGRKDPFIAAGEGDRSTKAYYNAPEIDDALNSQSPSLSYPPLMYSDDGSRVVTYKATAQLIQNPYKWQNGPREEDNETANPYKPKDIIYLNLWDNMGNNWDNNGRYVGEVVKTVYDPCPVGYHVSEVYTFSGFTTDGGNITNTNEEGNDYDKQRYAVSEENMLPEPIYRNKLSEFYTDATKLISIGFPQNGYRDWDDNGLVHKVNNSNEGQLWHAQSYIWAPYYNAWHFQFSRNSEIHPSVTYYATDGFPIRPTRTLPKK